MANVSLTPSRRWFSRTRKALQNPIVLKELRSRMRGRRAFVILTVYLILMSGVVLLLYSTENIGPSYRRGTSYLGEAIFGMVSLVQVAMVVLVGPAFTASAISGEKERQTFSLLKTTLISAESIITGKIVSALGYVSLLSAASLPLHGIALFFGGVDWLIVIVSQAVIFVAAISFALWGIYLSSQMKTTLSALVATYCSLPLWLLGIPFGGVIILELLDNYFDFMSSPDTWFEMGFQYVIYVIAASNLPFAAIFSLDEYQSSDTIFYSTSSTGSYTMYMVQPIWIFMLTNLLLAWWLYRRTVRKVRAVPNK